MTPSPQLNRDEAFRQALLKAQATIRQLMDENAALRKKDGVAVIGMGCRFPGGGNDPDRFWHHLRDGVDAVAEVPADRWPADHHRAADPDAPGKMYTARGGFLDLPIADFDAAFFGITPREARALDPQHRLVLEVGWEALEDACLDPAALKHSRTGVFVGISSDDYAQAHRHSGRPELIDAYSMTGSTFSTAVGRLSYLLGLHGPALAVDTACSSSLVALHLACRSLRSGETDLALVGGVNLILSPESHICFSKLRAISPTGRCRTFDAEADGYVRGEGCGFIVLKRTDEAVRDGNRVLLSVKGTAVNQDGRTNGLAAPNGTAQQAVVREALRDADLGPDDIDYVEAHGTGTLLGDPIEVEALGAVFGSKRQTPLHIGSVKTNIGHLEAAAGMAGLIKLILALRHETLPASLHFRTPNPHIAWGSTALRVVAEPTEWRRSQRPRVAGLSSFGFSGTNAHIVVEEPPLEPTRSAEAPKAASHLLCLSAHEPTALRALAGRYRALLAERAPDAVELGDLCHTAAAGRGHRAYRLAVEGADAAALDVGLSAFLDDRANPAAVSGDSEKGVGPGIAFLFTGQGSQYVGMGQGLYQSEPVFRDAVDRCDAILKPRLGFSIAERMFAGEAEALTATVLAQPALFVLEYALAQLWAAWGIRPQFLIGHSVGEYAAACLAGVFSLEDGLALIAERGRLMQALPVGGAMAAVMAPPDRVTDALPPFAGRLDVAAFNGPEHVVVSGDVDALTALTATLEADGLRVAQLAVSHAFHSHRMDPMLAAFEAAVRRVTLSPPRIPLLSNLSGAVIGDEIATPDYWVEHVRRPVAFAAGMEALERTGVRTFLELGPQATLLALGRGCLAEGGERAWLPSLKRNAPDGQVIRRALGALYVQGAPVDWAAVHTGRGERWTSAPTTPFQRVRHWVDNPRLGGKAAPAPVPSLAPLLDRMVRSPLMDTILFETRFGVAEIPLLAEHRVFDAVVVSGASLIAMILGAAERAFGEGTTQLSDLLLHQALVVPDGESRLVHLGFTPTDDAETSFRLVSLDASGDPASQTLHVSGKLRVGADAVAPPLSPPELRLAWDRLETELSGEEVRAAHAGRHITLGPSYVWLETMRLDPGEAIGRLRPPVMEPPLALDGYRMHPGLIDSWISLLAAMVGVSGDKPLVPFAVERLTLLRPPGIGKLLAYGRRRTLEGQPDRMVGDLWLFDEDGAPVAECLGLEGRQTTLEALLRRAGQAPADSWFHELRWESAPTAADARVAADHAAPWLIFADKGGTGQELADHLHQRGNHAIQVTAGEGFAVLERDRIRIDPRRAEDMAAVLERVTPSRVVYLWGLDATAPDAASFDAAAIGSCAPFLHLVAALAQKAAAAPPPPLAVVTRGAWNVEPDEPVEVAQAPLSGLARTVTLEHPELRVRHIDLSLGGRVPQIDDLWRELTVDDLEPRMALRGRSRRAPRLVSAPSPQGASVMTLRPDGAYLITGGLGALGRLMAQRLIARGARDLTLVGRSAPNENADAFLGELRATGATVRVHLADLADAKQVAHAVAVAASEQPLAGIVHAAGTLEDGVLAQLDAERLHRALAAKALGLAHLDEETRAAHLDFFIAFSSMVSLTGSAAQGAYAAANAAVDALMRRRRAMGLPGLSVNWGPWADVGMAARLDERQRDRLSRQGIGTLPPKAALDALERLTVETSAQTGIMRVDWAAFLRAAPGAADDPLFTHLRPPTGQAQAAAPAAAKWVERLRATPTSGRSAALMGLIREEISQVIGGRGGQPIGPRQPLFELGVDSLMAVELRGRLVAALGCPLATTLLFDHPTLEALTAHVMTAAPELADGNGSSETGPATQAPTTTMSVPVNAAETTTDLDGLSDTELEALLAERLGASLD
ncbi:type I polyketide synthase [Rhodospirillum sp. A1_3_36]|uniref:type I polyketide synthase n=1 Tax=Rhodospirillum sp. A1_3_36 TaxID=3391666 RepID=UPI0039A54E72